MLPGPTSVYSAAWTWRKFENCHFRVGARWKEQNVQILNKVNYRAGAKANLTEITSPERLASSICKCVDAVVS